MNKADKELKTILSLFYGDRHTMYEVIDHDGIRKPAISAVKIRSNGESEVWDVNINRRLLSEWLRGGER